MKQMHIEDMSVLKEYNRNMENKISQYQRKIKDLYEELIVVKKKKIHQKTFERNHDQNDGEERYRDEDIVICNTINSENNRQMIKGQLYSYRNPNVEDRESVNMDRFKRVTSPTSHSRDKNQKSLNNWFQQQRNILKKCEDRGQEAYYRTQYLKNTNSQFYY